jgi:hypothetical protein
MRFSKPGQNARFALIGALLLLSILPNLGAWAAPEAIGRLTEARGVVELNGTVATTGAELRLGMRVITGVDGRAVLTFADGQTVLLVPNSVFWIKDYRYAKNQPRENRSATELLKGGMRFISGTIAKETPEVVNIETPVATIGIRGTDFTVALGSLCLLVREGAIIVTAGGKSLVAQAGQIVFVPEAGKSPRLIPPSELRAPCPTPQDAGAVAPPATATAGCACRDLLMITGADALAPPSIMTTPTAPPAAAAPSAASAAPAITTATNAAAAAAAAGVAIGTAILLQNNEDDAVSP